MDTDDIRLHIDDTVSHTMMFGRAGSLHAAMGPRPPPKKARPSTAGSQISTQVDRANRALSARTRSIMGPCSRDRRHPDAEGDDRAQGQLAQAEKDALRRQLGINDRLAKTMLKATEVAGVLGLANGAGPSVERGADLPLTARGLAGAALRAPLGGALTGGAPVDDEWLEDEEERLTARVHDYALQEEYGTVDEVEHRNRHRKYRLQRTADATIHERLEARVNLYRCSAAAKKSLVQRVRQQQDWCNAPDSIIVRNRVVIRPPTCPRTMPETRVVANHANRRRHMEAAVVAYANEKERRLAAARRHDEIVAECRAAQAQESLEVRVMDWLIISSIGRAAHTVYRNHVMIQVYRQLEGFYSTQFLFFRRWLRPVLIARHQRKLRKVRQKLLSAYVAARLCGQLTIKRAACETVGHFFHVVAEAGRFSRALRTFKRRLLTCQAAVRHFLMYRMVRMQLSMLQWERLEATLRRDLMQSQKEDEVRAIMKASSRKDAPGNIIEEAIKKKSGEQTGSRKAIATAQTAGKKISPELQIELKVRDILEADPFTYDKKIPFSFMLELLDKDWHDRRRAHLRHVTAYHAQLELYAEEMKIFHTQKRMGRNPPAPTRPVKPRFPLLLQPDRLSRLVHRAMDRYKELSMEVRRQAADYVVRNNCIHDYYSVRDATYDDRFKIEILQRQKFYERARGRRVLLLQGVPGDPHAVTPETSPLPGKKPKKSVALVADDDSPHGSSPHRARNRRASLFTPGSASPRRRAKP